MIIYVINLKEEVQRRVNIERQLSGLGLTYKIIDAVNGKSLASTGEDDLIVDKNKAQEVMLRPLTHGEVGCALSHLTIYQEMVDRYIQSACILEDDVLINANFKELLTLVENSPDAELVFLGHRSLRYSSDEKGAERSFFFGKHVGAYYLARPAEFPLGTHAYTIRLAGAKKLLARGLPVWMPADFLTGSAEALSISTYLLVPPAVLTSGNATTITGRSFSRHIGVKIPTSVKGLIRQVLLFLRKLGIFRTSHIWVFNRRIAKHS